MYIFSRKELDDAINNSSTKGEVYHTLIGSKAPNSTTLSKFKHFASTLLSGSFDDYYRETKFFVTKNCPVCDTEFTKPRSSQTETCGYSCANTLFRSGKDNPNYKLGNKNYRNICFLHHDKACIICGESRIVEVHHYNEDHKDNRPENLVPLCSTHHKYYHSKYKYLVSDKIDSYVTSFLNKQT
jgi:hypothetical protein